MIGFDDQMITLKLEHIAAVKKLTSGIQYTEKFKQIVASIKAVGIVEPPVVIADKKAKGKYILLDGHLRIEALKAIGVDEVRCLVSKDDEAYTYNRHINRLSTIQEYNMILRAIERGVPEDKIAAALNVNVNVIRNKQNLLQGISPEAADLLKDKHVALHVFPLLRKMKPVRQIEAAILMNDAGNYSVSYAEALFAATPRDQLLDPAKPKKVNGLDSEQMARMENEMANLQGEYTLIQESYGTDILHLTLAKTYLSMLLGNAHVVRYLHQYHPEFLSQFQQITEMKSLTGNPVNA
jgi:hypothetical protein